MTKPMIAVAVLLVSAGAARAERKADLDRLERGEPGLAEVRRAALHHAGLADRPELSWTGRARLSALLPVLTVQINRGSGYDRDLSRSSSGTERLDVGSDRDISVAAKAVWNLDRLLFSDAELRAVKAAQQQYEERIQLLARVTSLYFQRRKLQITALWSPPGDPARAALQKLAIHELTAQLNALTGGYFAKALAENNAPK
ncbi:MAG: hypothetical protein MJE77_33440 [Proteobacteria bacterium]|nr:hypothetical protein [Pseudomonadota bacterium]